MTIPVFLLVLLAAVINATWNFSLRSLRGDLAMLWLAYWAGTLACVPIVIFRVATGSALPLPAVGLMLLSGCVHTLYMFGLAAAYRHGEVSLVYPVVRGMGVAGTAVFAVLLLGERVSAGGGFGIVAVCAGVTLLGVSQLHLKGQAKPFLIALAVGCTTITYSLMDSRGSAMMDPAIYVLGPFLVPAVLITPYALRHCRTNIPIALARHKKVILFTGVGGLVSYILVLFAFRLTGNAGYVMAVRESSVLFGSLMGFAWLGERVTWRRVTGLVAILAGLMLVKLAG